MSKELYRNKQIQEMFAWEEGLPMDIVSISEADKLSGSPKQGDMIAVNPKDGSDMWLVAKQFFEDNYEAALEAEPVEQEPVAWKCLVNGHHCIFECVEQPPEDAYDEGSLTPLYTHPATNEVSTPLKRLSDDEVADIWRGLQINNSENEFTLANAIQDAIAEKNK